MSVIFQIKYENVCGDLQLSNRRFSLYSQDSEWIEDPYYYEEYISEEDEPGEDYSTKNVPIWLSILLVLVYIGFGAYLFRVSTMMYSI